MSEAEEPVEVKQLWVTVVACVLVLLLLVVLYVLGVGPAYVLANRLGGAVNDVLEVLYTPLLYVMGECEWFGAYMQQYMIWCCDISGTDAMF